MSASQAFHLFSTTSSLSSFCTYHSPPGSPLLSGSGSQLSQLLSFQGTLSYGTRDRRVDVHVRQRCNAISMHPSQGLVPAGHQQDVFVQYGSPAIPSHDEITMEDYMEEVLVSNEIKKLVHTIKTMLGSMEDGEINTSAYDTAWVALVEDVNGSGTPQFPSSLDWIANNQLPDGSWGDGLIFEAHDRLINTLACVVALKSWNVNPDKFEKGMLFFKENLNKLEQEDPEHMPIGFEVIFPSLIEKARTLNIEVPYDSPALQEIYARRNTKLKKIPHDILHNVPSTLLHSLEGMPGFLDWEKLLKLQFEDGSFLFSPSSTAFALMQTKDENCLSYLKKVVQRFKGGAPATYPVDLFEHIWVVDRLQRLGISRYFQPEMKECVEYIYRNWSSDGICWARNSTVHDVDDTAMGFRVLRLHGYDVSTDAFKPFEKEGEFVCFVGQSTQAVTGMFNLYRASQVKFPGEKILDDARKFSSKFLREKQAANEFQDKWIIMKDLRGEVEYALEVPWYASLPRVESRFYIEQYGGEDDAWIGKGLYRMPYVSNNKYLQLARIDYNYCQALHRAEWDNFQKWYEECNLGDFGISRRTLLFAYFLAAASIFEPERSRERLAWAKTSMLLETIQSYFDEDNNYCSEQRRAFVLEFEHNINPGNFINGRNLDEKQIGRKELISLLLRTITSVSLEAMQYDHGRDISHSLRLAWEKWLLKWEAEGERRLGEAELLVQTINLTSGHWASDENLRHSHQYDQLCKLTNKLCYELGQYQQHKEHENGSCDSGTTGHRIITPEIEGDMQKLVRLVLQNSSSDGVESYNNNIKQTFLTVAKSFYYAAYCDPGTINYHIAKVLFERVPYSSF